MSLTHEMLVSYATLGGFMALNLNDKLQGSSSTAATLLRIRHLSIIVT